MRGIGLTGGIGSGKSTVARILQDCGGALVDTDAIARALTQPGGAAMPAIAAGFGPALLAADGGLDRDAMRRLAFSDPAARARLEAILHPLIGDAAMAQAAATSAGRIIVFDVPLLTESSHWRDRVDRVLVVDCREATQAERVAQRTGWTRQSALLVIEQQAGRARRRAVADAVIYNDGITPDQLRAEVLALWRHWACIAARVAA